MDLTSIIAVTATVTSFLCQLIGIEICLHIVRKGGTGEISPAPFIAFFVSTCIWLKYGLMLKLFNVVLTSGLGTILQFSYICLYYVYSKKKQLIHQMLVIGIIILSLPLVYVTYYEVDADKAKRNLGLYCSGLGIMCNASPLATLSKVIEHKSTESISFPLCFVNFLSSLQWTMYGAAIKDNVLLIPNALGILLGLAQFYLFWKYGCKVSKNSAVQDT
ncbi:unnamed protein product [Lymnaea stagnalis]|uniref:Sugar transporter SWEET1 n=1 Tax=Lymnaea stagnalis TaxID=6523 RepID=A0AAV2H101_LYMST